MIEVSSCFYFFTLPVAVNILVSMIDAESAAEEIGISITAYKRLCVLFLSTVDDDIKKLPEAAESGNREELRSRAHHIKGAAVNLEFTALARQAEYIQNIALKMEIDVIRTELRLLYDEYAKLRTEIEVVL